MAKVHPSTVSRVLNGKLDNVRISEATSERVRRAAATLRYQPNAAARSLRTTYTQTIGVIAHNLLHPFVAELLRVIYAVCQARGYHLLLGHTEHSAAEGSVLGAILSADRVDGVLLIGDILPDAAPREAMQWLIETHNHVVTVGGRPSVAGEQAIMVDNACGVTLAMEHLSGQGHRSIGYVSERVGAESWEDRQRREAYRGFLHAHDLHYHAAAELAVTNHVETVQEALRALFGQPNHPTALFVNNDVTALITMKAASMCGLRVPDDLSIVGFDDIPFSALSTPGLTTVRQPIEAMGRQAASALLDRAIGTAAVVQLDEGGTVFLPPTLVQRESAAPPRGSPLRQETHVA